MAATYRLSCTLFDCTLTSTRTSHDARGRVALCVCVSWFVSGGRRFRLRVRVYLVACK